jgi:enoyl-CoA hydratase
MISHSLDGLVATITLDRPERRNALDAQACLDVADAVEEVVTAGARALVLRGAGGHFCAGADLSTVTDPDFGPALRAALDAVAEAPIAVLAAIEGACMGAGVQLAVAADIRVATEGTRFAIPAARLGIVVDHWTTRRVSRALGPGQAAALLLAAEELTGRRAFDLGFVQRVGTFETAVGWAEEIAALAPLSIRGHKLGLRHVDDEDHDVPQDVAEARDAAWASADLVEGRLARTERRRPEFGGV